MSTVKELRTALQFASNTLGVPLNWDRDTHVINGGGLVEGAPTLAPRIDLVDSLVNEDRGVIVLAFNVLGCLSGILLVDAQEKKAQLFLVDGAKLGMTKTTPDSPLPKFWARGWLYGKIVEALKVTYSTTYLSSQWGDEQRGNQWMVDYLTKKRRAAMDRAVQP